jgi:hypothetical protein
LPADFLQVWNFVSYPKEGKQTEGFENKLPGALTGHETR